MANTNSKANNSIQPQNLSGAHPAARLIQSNAFFFVVRLLPPLLLIFSIHFPEHYTFSVDRTRPSNEMLNNLNKVPARASLMKLLPSRWEHRLPFPIPAGRALQMHYSRGN